MILDTLEANLVAAQGWNDRGALWWCQTLSASQQTIPLGGASHLTLHRGLDDFFAVVHHFNPLEGNRVIVTAHAISSPGRVFASIILPGQDQDAIWEGDVTMWHRLPSAFIAYYYYKGDLHHLLLINAEEQRVETQAFGWYESDSYDQGYQELLQAVEIPGQNLLLISIQRDSNPVLYDPGQQKAVGKISLANRYGNPHLEFRHKAFELWANDYDTLLSLDPRDWSVKNSLRLQSARFAPGASKESAGVARFIGHFCFNKDESLCAVARPYSGDIIALDTQTFEPRYRAVTGRQPLDVALLSDGRVFCRDWKTGDLLLCQLEPLTK